MTNPTSNPPSSFSEAAFFSWYSHDPSTVTINNLIEELVSLLGKPVIQDHQEAKNLLTRWVDKIHCRKGLEPLEENEIGFYNLSQQLLDGHNQINNWCLDRLKTIQYESTSSEELNRNIAFNPTRRYKLIASPSVTEHRYHALMDMLEGAMLKSCGHIPRDWRDEHSTYVILSKTTNPCHALWNLSSQDGGKTYTIAVATNDFAQKGWFLDLHHEYPNDSRNHLSVYAYIHRPNRRPQAWHVCNEGRGIYKISVAANSDKKSWLLGAHRLNTKDNRCNNTTYAMAHAPETHKYNMYWRIEPV